MLPNFFLVGAQKAGTTSLYEYLRQHPQIFLPALKEPTYLASDCRPENFVGAFRESLEEKQAGLTAYLAGPMTEWCGSFVFTWPEYQAVYRDAVGFPVVGDASPSYLSSLEAAGNIRRLSSDAKIVMILRDPVDRALSAFRMAVRDGKARGTFSEAIAEELRRTDHSFGTSHRLVVNGMYGAHVERYLATFRVEQIRVYRYEQLDSEPDALLRDLFQFLGVDHAFKADIARRYNTSLLPRLPFVNRLLSRSLGKRWLERVTAPFPGRVRGWMRRGFYRRDKQALSDRERAPLVEVFRADILRLSELLKTDFSDWLR